LKRSLTLTLLAISLLAFANLAGAASRPSGDLRLFAAGDTPSAVNEPCVPSPDCARAWDSYDRLFYEGTKSGVEVTGSQEIPSVHLVPAVRSGTITFTHDVGATVEATALTATYNGTPPPDSVSLEARSSNDGQTYFPPNWSPNLDNVPPGHVLQVRAALKRVNGTSPDIRSITLRAQPSDYCRGLGGTYVYSCYGSGHPETLGTKKMIAIRVKFADDGPWDPTKDEAWARNKMAQLNAWLVENSYDQMRLNGSGSDFCCGDVYRDVVSMTFPKSCTYRQLSRDVMRDLDLLPDIKFANYNYVWFVREPHHPDENQTCPGIGSVGSNWLGTADEYYLSKDREVFLAYQWNDYLETRPGGMVNGLMHEFVHGLWTSHSDYPHGRDGADAYDVMGSGFYEGAATDTNAIHKEMIGWLKPPRLMTVTQGGTFIIGPSELQTPALKVLKVSPPNIEPVYVEMRKLIGFDCGLTPANPEGVVLNSMVPGYPFPNEPYDSYLFNPYNTPDDWSGSPQDVVLKLNKAFPIPGSNWTITLRNITDTEATVQVSFPVSGSSWRAGRTPPFEGPPYRKASIPVRPSADSTMGLEPCPPVP